MMECKEEEEKIDGEGGGLIEWEWPVWTEDKQLVFVKVPQTALRHSGSCGEKSGCSTAPL